MEFIWLKLAGITVLILLIIMFFIQLKISKNKYIGKEKELTENPKDKNIFGQSGVFFSRKGNKIICKSETEEGHVLVVGGSGSGKSTSIIIPTLRDYKSNVFAIDIKGELAETVKKHGFREGRRQILINPRRLDSAKYDPFQGFYKDGLDSTIEKIARLCFFIVPEEGQGEEIWPRLARKLLTGLLSFYYLYRDLSFSECLEEILLNGLEQEQIKEIISEISEDNNPTKNYGKINLYLNNFCEMNRDTYTSVVANVTDRIIDLATNADLKNNVLSIYDATNKVKFRDLEERNTDIFLQIKEEDLSIFGDFIALLIGQFLDFFQTRENNINNKEILFIVDELPRLGKINGLQNALSTLRSKRISVLMAIQSMAQLNKLYGKETAKIVVDNCGYIAILSATEPESARYFADMIGKYDARVESVSVSANKKTKTQNLQEKYQFPPDELRTLPHVNKLILLSPTGFYLLDKRPFYKEI